MKKKKMLLAVSVLLAGILTVGATMAYFTDTDTATNVITMGNVNISLSEPVFASDEVSTENEAGEYEYNQVIYPGQPIHKDPTITVEENSLDAYLRVKIEVDGTKVTAADVTAILASLKVKKGAEETLVPLAEAGWVAGNDGYYYYQFQVSAGDIIKVFDQFCVPDSWTNDYADSKFSIIITAEAIQHNYFTPHKTDGGVIDGWFDAADNPIQAETYTPPASN